MTTFDVVVIGAGTGGQTAAHDLAAEGWSVAVVEESRRPGGVCALAGCQAKKYFYEVAEIMARSRHLAGKGIQRPPLADWGEIENHKRRFTSQVPESTVKYLKAAGITFFQEPAAFVDDATLRVGDRTIQARYYVVATGARPMDLPFEGREHLLTSDNFLDLGRLPERLVFVGGGFISFEFAHFAARLGGPETTVTILEAADRPLGPFDAEMVEYLSAASAEDGITIRSGIRIEAIARTSSGYEIRLASGETMAADLIVHGAGRVPRLDGLNPAAAGIDSTTRGIAVDAYMRTSNPRVFAVGDCAATIQLARVADAEAHVAAAAITAELKSTASSGQMDYSATPFLLFTYPQYGMIGQTETALAEAGHTFYTSRGNRLGYPTYRRVGLRHAAFKIMVDSDNRLLGAHILSDNAAGLINTFHLAMENDIRADTLYRQHIMSPYPSRESDLIYMLEPFHD
ncbi:MAG: NAD(P)/FAD-dependent oxidoreductase [Desulfosudaceae bacterium]